MDTHWMETPEMGVSILIDGVGKPFSVRPAADDDLVLVLLLESNVLMYLLRKNIKMKLT